MVAAVPVVAVAGRTVSAPSTCRAVRQAASEDSATGRPPVLPHPDAVVVDRQDEAAPVPPKDDLDSFTPIAGKRVLQIFAETIVDTRHLIEAARRVRQSYLGL